MKRSKLYLRSQHYANSFDNTPYSKLRWWTVEEQTCAVQLVSDFRPCLTVVVVRSRRILNSLMPSDHSYSESSKPQASG